ncbi:MAG: tail fiber domain-containing protein, partial [Cyanobacteriota bacterium]|nr:tail fiber domain-containing protein [Cyanobacteriota bacterium]
VVRGNYYPADNAESKIVYNTLTDTKTIGAENAYYRCNGDTLRSILSYRGYACNQMTTSNPKSINVWQKGGDCSSDTEYPKGNGCPNITSDRRLKNIISENNDGLDKLEQLVPYNYVYKSDKTRTPHTGVIAQDLQQVFPISVSKDSKGFLQIRWDEMFYALINSIKQLSAKVDELTGKISEMSKDVLSINSKQNDIQKELKVLNNRINKLERK